MYMFNSKDVSLYSYGNHEILSPQPIINFEIRTEHDADVVIANVDKVHHHLLQLRVPISYLVLSANHDNTLYKVVFIFKNFNILSNNIFN